MSNAHDGSRSEVERREHWEVDLRDAIRDRVEVDYERPSLRLRDDLTFFEFMPVFIQLGKTVRGVLFLYGDCYLEGVRLFGEDAMLQIAPTGYASETLRGAVRVCELVPPGLRRPDLPWSHHKEVATVTLAPAQRKELLDRAAPDPFDEERRPRLTVRELRAEVAKTKRAAGDERRDAAVERDDHEHQPEPDRPLMFEEQCACCGGTGIVRRSYATRPPEGDPVAIPSRSLPSEEERRRSTR